MKSTTHRHHSSPMTGGTKRLLAATLTLGLTFCPLAPTALACEGGNLLATGTTASLVWGGAETSVVENRGRIDTSGSRVGGRVEMTAIDDINLRGTLQASENTLTQTTLSSPVVTTEGIMDNWVFVIPTISVEQTRLQVESGSVGGHLLAGGT